jgi:hypothetical protein
VAANPPQDLKWHLVFNGEGQQEAPSSERQKIADLAQEVGDQARQVQDPAALEAVKGALVAYLEALKQGDYQTVVSLYGGSYDVLADMNPDVSPADRIALWTRACEQNGFVCNLTVKNWVQIAQLSDDEFRLSVELQNADGSLFELGPCCGEEMEAFPPLTQFEFVVKRVGEAYLVQRLPVFVP